MEKDIAQWLAELEDRVRKLEATAATEATEATETNPTTPGTIQFSGAIKLQDRTYRYEWVRPAEHLLSDSFEDSLTRVAALAHPLRHQILRALLQHPATVSELVDAGLSSTGTTYHHLSALQSAGWVEKSGGAFSIPPARVVPLLTIIAAGEPH
ncbi:ArsR/SmtB family transcription factor [Corynebacterium epidermidicanis]|uniref:DNA binding protein with helix-turn-helix domain n=1 Tax=Corynebacterium epidermidicanis TaxID=1050174 RepID=A0A0G3GVN0_9CORY|nr:winged helix-turn-helix domain-containing protein [Corynebacterium epidermidicanis]AKK02917.1 DNA binding protein with helix-turn-helix domain [Corynebacterium epidermidicanis]